ncbi:hypothetical protein GCM10022206_94620 [Streptomyces chiangmaiensis]
MEDISIAGVTIRRSDPILNSYAAACEDPDKYGPTAGDFDITRSDKDHLAFDHGVHFCLGGTAGPPPGGGRAACSLRPIPRLAAAVRETEVEPMRSFISNGHRALPALLT